ncbi:MAG: hypothetical protein F6K54_36240 [Okeania sp. SIO3B5]|nr:hypothetical protein [Okeania sp. SIO3B5]NEO58032.1 hypothetical protein [Okeania sp. SIO3B5]
MFNRKRLKILPVKALIFNQQSNNYCPIDENIKNRDRYLSRISRAITIGQ